MRLAHLTDLHLRRSIPGPAVQNDRRSREVAELLPRALADARSRGVEVVVLTGDLVDVPHYLFDIERDPAADQPLWAAVREDYRWLRRVLDESGIRWVALPGNHDHYRMVREELGDRPMIEDIAGVRVVSFWDREHADHVPQRILAERRRFDAVLGDPDPMPQVHLQHFVIAPERNDGYPMTYLEGAELRTRLADRDGPTLVLSGHDHTGAEPEWHGRALFSITPGFTEAPHPYRIFELAADAETAGARITWEQVDLGAAARRPAVFLDRDGCICTLPTYHGGPEAMEILPGAALGIRRLRRAGYRIVVVTNQAGVGKGYATPAVVDEVNDRMHALLAEDGAEVDAVSMSFQAGDRAVAETYRAGGMAPKPSPEMLLTAANTLDLDLERSFMIGDRAVDLGAALAPGVTPILVRTGDGRLTEGSLGEGGAHRPLVVDDLTQAAQAIVDGRTSDPEPLDDALATESLSTVS